jgi:hypothetical protein
MTALSARVRALALILVGAVAFAIAPAAAAHAEGPGSVTVTVTADGSPVLFAFVVLDGPDFAFGNTEESGVAEFSDLALGDYTIELSSTPEYQGASVAFSLTEEAPHSQQAIELTPWPTGDGSVSGTVVDSATQQPIPGILISAGNFDSGQTREGLTDENGHYAITGLVAGFYGVAISDGPGYFSDFEQLEIGEAEAATVDFALLAADAAISGRVVDPDGNGVPGLWLGAFLVDDTLSGSTSGEQTDADGYYTLTGAGAGTWLVQVDADSMWERATVEVDVEAASTAPAPDIVLTPRTTGGLSGLVGTADGIPETEIGGVFDICVTVLEPDGTPVPDATMTTGGDSFFFFSLQPGDYTVFFEDCDLDREPHRYQSAYLDGSATIAAATIVTVETAADTWVGRTLLEPDTSLPVSEHDATPVAKHDLQPADENLIVAPTTLRRGETAEVLVGAEYAGQWVSAWLYPRPTQLGEWHQVSAQGTIEIVVPSHHPIGVRKLVVQDADDEVIGWTDLRVQHRAR